MTTMSSPHQDPHYVDPKPSLVVAVARADLLVVNGLELEIGWLPPIIVNSRNMAVQVGATGHFDASLYADVQEVPAQANRAMGDIHPGGNPHYLYDPRQAAAIAIGNKLAELDSERRTFTTAAQSGCRATSEDRSSTDRAFRSTERVSTTIVTYHRSLVYLIDCSV